MPRKPATSSKPKLAVIGSAPAADRHGSPVHLGEVAAQLWRDVTSNYEFDDPASQQVLLEACNAIDRSERCRRTIDADGECYRSRSGMMRPHPLLTAEVQSRALACRLLANLGLNLEPVRPGPGRPPGGVGISWEQLRDAD